MPLDVDLDEARDALTDAARRVAGLLRGAAGSGPADCHLAAEPVAFLLIGYGRIGQWGPIARGKLRAWGRRPWLALRFKNLFFNP